tara:strand:+ start:349 stop:915 length:567 start_codon:yes stop_codon:yes gene_type:complete
MLKDLKAALQKMGKETVNGARNELTKIQNTSGALSNSLMSKTEETRDGIDLIFIMEEYGMFLDAGVYGSNPNLVNTKNSKGKQKGKQTNSVFTGANGIAEKFSYKQKKPPLNDILAWAQTKNISLKRKNGTVASYTSIAFWLQKRIFAQGISPTLFFTKPFLKAFNNLPDEILKEFDFYINTVLEEDK